MTNFELAHARRCERLFLYLFLAHLPLFLATSFFFETAWLEAVGLWALVLGGAALAHWRASATRWSSAVFGVAAIGMSGILIHAGRGLIEMHFHVFVSLGLLIVLADAVALLAAAATAAVHHAGLFFLLPSSVFNYDASLATVAGHAAFVVVQTAGCLWIARHFRRALHQRGVLGEQLTLASREMVEGLHGVVASSQTAAESSANQQSAVEDGVRALSQMSARAADLSRHLASANEAAISSRGMAEEGAAGIASLRDATTSLTQLTKRIGQITSTVDGIAFQIHMLSLNASVEAARAGDAGAGFAVVAEEVRNLAQRSAQAAGDTALAVEETLNVATSCVQLTGSVSTKFDGIRQHARQLAVQVQSVSSTADLQAGDAVRLESTLGRVRENAAVLAGAVQRAAAPLSVLGSRSEHLDRVVRDLAAAE